MSLSVGSGVRRRMSGWAGHITKMTPCDQRVIVTVKPTRPRPLEVFDRESKTFIPTPDDWDGWGPITCYLDELEAWESARSERSAEGDSTPAPGSVGADPEHTPRGRSARSIHGEVG